MFQTAKEKLHFPTGQMHGKSRVGGKLHAIIAQRVVFWFCGHSSGREVSHFRFRIFTRQGHVQRKYLHTRWCNISLPSHLFSPNFPAEWIEMCGYCWPYITPCELDSFAKITQSIK